MRPKVAVIILLLAVSVLAGLYLLRPPSRPPSVAPAVDSAARPNVPQASPPVTAPSDPGSVELKQPPAGAAILDPASAPAANGSALASSATATNTARTPQHDAAIRARVTQLGQLAMRNDPASLQTILSELTNSTKAIRQAALEATVQYGSRDAIPKLQEIAAATEDQKEKAAILEAAEFLQLPSLSELGRRLRPKAKPPARPAPAP
jgi:LAS superfamily LD-carboxypeptidase LdcB